jgi:prepilin-type N-terminal cleavage/methylation domain-containing protein
MRFLKRRSERLSQGMTLPEVVVTTAIFSMAMAGFVGIHLFSLRYNQTISLKLLANNEARNVLNRVAEDVRSAGWVRVGDGDAAIFTEAAFGQRQEGNAIQIYPQKLQTNRFIRYYLDTDDHLLKRFITGEPEIVLARSVTNVMVFTSEDGFGRVLSNNFNNRVIGMTLQFAQDPYRVGGSGFLYDYYQIRTKVTRRALE